MGVENIITFDAHDPRVQNAIPLRGFETVQPIYPVSYTHLDVYKRQVHAFAVVSNLKNQVSFPYGPGNRYPAKTVAQVVKTVGNAVPVSYTHLRYGTRYLQAHSSHFSLYMDWAICYRTLSQINPF